MTDCDILHIPEGINFECTACGACCQKWPIVVHDEDRVRITQLLPEVAPDTMFELLPADQRVGLAYSYITQKREDDRCVFLNADDLCNLHAQFGADAKPGMCRLFPYIFLPTPSGVYTSLSFASTGVRLNSGKALLEQRNFLAGRWRLQQNLTQESIDLTWQDPDLLPGQPMLWQEYLDFEEKLLQIFHPVRSRNESLVSLCHQACTYVDRFSRSVAQQPLNEVADQSNSDLVDSTLVDCLLVDCSMVEALSAFYWPEESVALSSDLDHCRNYHLGPLSPEAEDLLQRFIYSRIFGKTYFGAGHSNLSVISGFYNLITVVVLIRLQIKLSAIRADTLTLTSNLLTALERRHPIMEFSPNLVFLIEELFRDQKRITRLLALAD